MTTTFTNRKIHKFPNYEIKEANDYHLAKTAISIAIRCKLPTVSLIEKGGSGRVKFAKVIDISE